MRIGSTELKGEVVIFLAILVMMDQGSVIY